ncbi:MAG: hypothetical protein HOW73_39195 [Polyangiaceae bacterium]|nr:hypothetical protein [Polyangiaceae bacterium]
MDNKSTAARVATEAWGIPVSKTSAVDVTKEFRWCRRREIFYVETWDRDCGLIAVGPDDTVFRFVDSPAARPEENRAARLAAMNELLKAEDVDLPWGVEPAALAATVHALLVDPRGLVASRRFLEEQKSAIDTWTYLAPHRPRAAEHTQAERRELFVRACTDPILHETRGSWTLDFSYFAVSGAVERWHITGTTERVVSASDELALRAGTFKFPYL